MPNNNVLESNFRDRKWTVVAPNGDICLISDKLTLDTISSIIEYSGIPRTNEYNPEVYGSYIFGWDVTMCVDWTDEFQEDLLQELCSAYYQGDAGFEQLNIKSWDDSEEVLEKIKSGFSEEKISYSKIKDIITKKFTTYNGIHYIEKANSYLHSNNSKALFDTMKTILVKDQSLIGTLNYFPLFDLTDRVTPYFSLNHYKNPFYKMFHSDTKSLMSIFYSKTQEHFKGHFSFPFYMKATDGFTQGIPSTLLPSELLEYVTEIINTLVSMKEKISFTDKSIKFKSTTIGGFSVLLTHLLFGITVITEITRDYSRIKTFVDNSVDNIIQYLEDLKNGNLNSTAFINTLLSIITSVYSTFSDSSILGLLIVDRRLGEVMFSINDHEANLLRDFFTTYTERPITHLTYNNIFPYLPADTDEAWSDYIRDVKLWLHYMDLAMIILEEYLNSHNILFYLTNLISAEGSAATLARSTARGMASSSLRENDIIDICHHVPIHRIMAMIWWQIMINSVLMEHERSGHSVACIKAGIYSLNSSTKEDVTYKIVGKSYFNLPDDTIAAKFLSGGTFLENSTKLTYEEKHLLMQWLSYFQSGSHGTFVSNKEEMMIQPPTAPEYKLGSGILINKKQLYKYTLESFTNIKNYSTTVVTNNHTYIKRYV